MTSPKNEYNKINRAKPFVRDRYCNFVAKIEQLRQK